jgi:ABC-type proline/glycine betaine transport system ATPase subunit
MRFRQVLKRVAEALELVNLDPRVVLSKLPAELSGECEAGRTRPRDRGKAGDPALRRAGDGAGPGERRGGSPLIQQLAEELGVTSIIVTHDIEGALPISDRVAMLDRGRIRFVGSPLEFRESDDVLVRAFMERDAMAGLNRDLEAV